MDILNDPFFLPGLNEEEEVTPSGNVTLGKR